MRSNEGGEAGRLRASATSLALKLRPSDSDDQRPPDAARRELHPREEVLVGDALQEQRVLVVQIALQNLDERAPRCRRLLLVLDGTEPLVREKVRLHLRKECWGLVPPRVSLPLGGCTRLAGLHLHDIAVLVADGAVRARLGVAVSKRRAGLKRSHTRVLSGVDSSRAPKTGGD